MAIRQIGISAVLAAVYSRLTTSAYMTGYTTKVYNYVPEGTAMPYIRFGDPGDFPSALFASRDFEPEQINFSIHVWSNYQGNKQCGDIMDAVCQALTDATLYAVDWRTLYTCRLSMAEITIDNTEPARPVRHGVLRFYMHVDPYAGFILGDDTVQAFLWASATKADEYYGYLCDYTTGLFSDGDAGKKLND